MPVPQDYRVDPFSGAKQYVSVVAEPHTVPANSPLYVYLDEIPDSNSPIAVRLASIAQTLQPDSSSGQDTWLDEANPTTNYGAGTYINVGTGALNGAAPYRYRALIQFSIGSLPASVQKAVLRLYLQSATGTQTLALYRVTGAWTAGAATWSSPPDHYLVAVTTAQVTAGAGYYEWDITDLYNKWQAGTYPNDGIMLTGNDETVVQVNAAFTAADSTVAAQRPALVLTVPQTALTQVGQTVPPAAGEFAANMDVGALRLNIAQAGVAIEVDYTKTGSGIDAADVGDLNRLVGSGTDGDLNVLTGVYTLTGTEYHFHDVYVAPGATLTIAGPDPVSIGYTGAFSLYGTLNIDGKGYAGGAGGTSGGSGQPGQGPGGGGAGLTSPMVLPAGLSSLYAALAWWAIANNLTGGATDIRPFDGLPVVFATATNWATTGAWGDINGGMYFIAGLTPAQMSALQAALPTISTYAQLASYIASNFGGGSGGGGGGGGNHVAGSPGTGAGAGAGGNANTYRDTRLSDFLQPDPGGGGGGASGSPGGAGGAGGGGLLIQGTGLFYVDGAASWSCVGEPGSSPDGGGGAGGYFWVRASRRDIRVNPNVSGGAGNGTGGAGAAGWYVFEDI